MRAGGGKSKGGAWERQVCVALSLWISHGKRKDLFWRSAVSGGRATVNRKKGESNLTQCGDISAVHPDGHKLTDLFTIECKTYADLEILQGLLFGKGKFEKFWLQTCDQALNANTQPLLIAKQNRMKPLLITSGSGQSYLGLGMNCPLLTGLYQFDEEPHFFLFDTLLKTKCPL